MSCKFFNLDTNSSLILNTIKPDENELSREVIAIHCKDKLNFIFNYIRILSEGNIPQIINSSIPIDSAKKISLGRIFTGESEIAREPYYIKAPLGHYLSTSGTTSNTGKGRTFFFPLERPIKNAMEHNYSLNLSSRSKVLFPLPLSHSFGTVVGIHATMHGEFECYLTKDSFNITDIFKTIEDKDIDVLYLTPAIVRQIIKHHKFYKKKVISPKKISIGSSMLYENEAYALYRIFPNSELFYTYGVTEMGPRVSTNFLSGLTNTKSPLSIGDALDGVELIVERDELIINSPYSSTDIEENFHTRDKAYFIDEDIFIQGRLDDTIIYQGINIYPDEIETVLIENSDIKECALIGLNNDTHGSVPVLVIPEHADVKKVWEVLQEKVPLSHLPKMIKTLPQLPKTELGKIRRKEIANHIEATL